MKKFSFLIVLTVTAILISNSNNKAQTAWTKAKGKGYFKFSQSLVRANSFFNPEGEIIDITTTSVYQTGVYGEYGISDGITAIINAPLFVRSTINNLESNTNGGRIEGDEFNGIGDITIGLKYGILSTGSTGG